ncbi:succinyl-CoA synthetase subunit beta [Jannaschia pohangensis]|nr:succinyl-CoA synthetase subunit beta [Jannaschia pohangensis]
MVVLSASAMANPARAAMLDAFATNCFSPFLNAATAEANIASTGARIDYYDLTFAVVQRTSDTDITPGTDRRCEVSFDGDHGADAAEVATNALAAERILTDAPLPATHADAALPGTTLLAARALNPNRVAVVHTGTRPGPNGVETFLSVERLTPNASSEALR